MSVRAWEALAPEAPQRSEDEKSVTAFAVTIPLTAKPEKD